MWAFVGAGVLLQGEGGFRGPNDLCHFQCALTFLFVDHAVNSQPFSGVIAACLSAYCYAPCHNGDGRSYSSGTPESQVSPSFLKVPWF